MPYPIDVVLDTNILVSALMSDNGISATIYRMVHKGELVPYFCDAIMDEYLDVLFRPELKLDLPKVSTMLQIFAKQGKHVTPSKSDICLPDEDDRTFYDVSNDFNAILITGNTRHFPDESFIMTPRTFYDTYVV